MTQTDDVKTYSQGCDDKSYAYILNKRNIGMIDACDILIAIYDGTPGVHEMLYNMQQKQKS